jgi:hypothetical protein
MCQFVCKMTTLQENDKVNLELQGDKMVILDLIGPNYNFTDDRRHLV